MAKKTIKVRHDEIPQTKRPDITVGMLSPTNYDEPAYLRSKKWEDSSSLNPS